MLNIYTDGTDGLYTIGITIFNGMNGILIGISDRLLNLTFLKIFYIIYIEN